MSLIPFADNGCPPRCASHSSGKLRADDGCAPAGTGSAPGRLGPIPDPAVLGPLAAVVTTSLAEVHVIDDVGSPPPTAGHPCWRSSRMRPGHEVGKSVPLQTAKDLLGVVVAEDRDELRRRLRLPDPSHGRRSISSSSTSHLKNCWTPLCLFNAVDAERVSIIQVWKSSTCTRSPRRWDQQRRPRTRIAVTAPEIPARAETRPGDSCSGWSPDSCRRAVPVPIPQVARPVPIDVRHQYGDVERRGNSPGLSVGRVRPTASHLWSASRVPGNS